MAELFTQVAKPTATMETAGAFLGRWRLMSIDGMAWDIPDIPANAAAFGYPRAGKDGAPGAFPKAQVVTVSECASHAAVLAAIGPFALKAGGERALGRRLYPKLEEDWLLIADSGFYDRQDWCTAADTGPALLWRFKSDIRRPVLEILPDGSYRSVLVTPKTKAAARQELVETAGPGRNWTPEGPGTSASWSTRSSTGTARTNWSPSSPPSPTRWRPRRPPWRRLTTKDGSTRPPTPSSRPSSEARAMSCGRSLRT